MKEQLTALKGKLKSMGKKVINKLGEATMTEHELREKHGAEPVKSYSEKLKEAQEATTMPNMPAPSVMSVGRRIIK